MNQTAQDFYSKGLEACDKKDFSMGLEYFSKALALSPGFVEARYNRAKVFYQLKQLPEALNDFNILLENDSENAHYYGERAIIHFMLHDHKESIADLDKAVELQPSKPYRYASRAFLKDRMGDLQGAIEDYDRAIALDPEDAISHNNKGLVEEKMGYIDRSKKSFSKADALDPNNIGKSPDLTELNSLTEENPEIPMPAISKTDKRLGVKEYFRQLRRLVSSPEERTEFADFLKGLFK
jgi:tetratricopeptide (TPR) repeat protein